MKYWPIAALVIQALTAWACWSLRQLATSEVKKLVDAAVASLSRADQEAEAALDDHETRITVLTKDVEAIRHDIAQLPTKADHARLEGEVKSVGTQVQRTAAGIERIESYFLAKGVERG